MDFEKKNTIYKAIMLAAITAFITFVVTFTLTYNYYINTPKGKKEVVEKVISQIDISELGGSIEDKLRVLKTYLDVYYLGDINENKMLEGALKGYVDGLGDKYTAYLTKQEYEELMISVTGDYVGIGIYMTQDKDDNVVIITPIEDSPAEAAGLKPGDIIVKVDGEECKGKDVDLTSNKIKGEEGTTVNIEISRDGEVFEKTIERKKIIIHSVRSKVLEENVGYIEILSFDGRASEEFESHYNDLKSKGITSLIIDVRDNGGGLVSSSLKIAEFLAPKDKILMKTVDREGKEEITKSKKDRVVDMDAVLLINEYSASASEILAGACKDNNLAKLVGAKTFGKGTMQELVPIEGTRRCNENYNTGI